MVDFNNDATIGTPAVDVERISILQRRYDLIEAIEHYYKNKFNNVTSPLSLVRSRLISLYLELESTIKRQCSDEDIKLIKEACFEKKSSEENILEATTLINLLLDRLRLTRIDLKKDFDRKKIEDSNKHHEYS